MADDRTGMVQVELSDEDVAQRAAKLASEGIAKEELEEKKRSHVLAWNEQIKQLETSISVLNHEVDERKAWVPAQAGMFAEPANDDESEPEAKPRGRRRRGNNDLHA